MNKPHSNVGSESVLRVLDVLSKSPGVTQREVARVAGLSLGMVNAILRRLSKTGVIKVRGLTGRKLSYMLTPHGLSEKTRRSTEYIKHTIQTYEELRHRISLMLKELELKGHKDLLILGEGEVAQLTEMVIKETGNGWRYSRSLEPLKEIPSTALVLDCTAEGGEPAGISVLSRLIATEPVGSRS